ncbi:MAG: NUDIX hydrolase [Clostridia bacterium]|nr:NUDIX hydrolase [Clostridia bacterium]
MKDPISSFEETKLSCETLFEGKVLTLQKDIISLPNGNTAFREIIRHKGAVCVIAYNEKDGTIFAVKQYRYAQGEMLFEIPAGKLDFIGEDPLDAAKRELSEETGCTAKKWVPLGLYYGSPAILDEKIYMFAAFDLSEGESHPDSDEFLQVCRVPLKEAKAAVLNGEIPDGKTQVAILRLCAMLSL